MDEKMPSREDFLLVQKTAEEIGREIFEKIVKEAKDFQKNKDKEPHSAYRVMPHDFFIEDVKIFLALDRFAEGAAAMARNAEE